MAEEIDILSTDALAEEPAEDTDRCLHCGADVARAPAYTRYRVCPQCRFHYNLPALRRISLLTDAGTFREINQSLVPLDPLSFSDHLSYRDRLSQAQSVTGLLEAVVTGTANIGGIQAVLAVTDFGFMGGSIGSAVGEKIAQAAEAALRQRIPFVLVASGGTPRIREGMLSLMQMAKVVATLKRLRKKPVPFIAVLASTASSYLFSSAASMADVIIAEPGALVGFVPKKVVERASGKERLPKDYHTAEFYQRHGAVDTIVDRQNLKQHLALLLDLFSVKFRLTIANRARLQAQEAPQAPAWERLQLARHEQRPTARDFVERVTSNFVELHGDRVNADDQGMMIGMGYLAGEAVMVIGNDRGGDGDDDAGAARVTPAGLRKAQRALHMAERFKLPVITLIDTPGVLQTIEAEEQGIAAAVGETISSMSDLRTPIISVIIGEGGSEAALALSVADRILMLENAIFTPITPEAAALILYRDPDKVEEVAEALKLTAYDCRTFGIVDVVVPGAGGRRAHELRRGGAPTRTDAGAVAARRADGVQLQHAAQAVPQVPRDWLFQHLLPSDARQRGQSLPGLDVQGPPRSQRPPHRQGRRRLRPPHVPHGPRLTPARGRPKGRAPSPARAASPPASPPLGEPTLSLSPSRGN